MKTYLRHRIVNVIDIKELSALEYLDFEGRYQNYKERHPFYELCYVEKGDVSVSIDDEESVIYENELILIAPNETHSYHSPYGNRSRAFVICFESPSSALRSLADKKFSLDATQESCMKVIIDESQHTFRMNAKDLLEIIDHPNFGGQQVILSQLSYLLITLMRHLSGKKDSELVILSDEAFYRDLVGIVIGYFEENLSSKLSLDEICDRVNYSRSFLCKTFKEQTGETLIGCFNRMKIEEAKRLLWETDLPVTEIAARLAFSELKYFCSLFKKQVGTTPTAYKKEKHL